MLFLPQILEILKQPDYIPLSIERLAEKMAIPEKQFTAFKREVTQHMRQGTLVKLKKNRICLPRDADLLTGIVKFRQSGSAMLIPDAVEGGDPPQPYHVDAEDTGVAMHGDRVVGRIHRDRRRFRQRQQGSRAQRDLETVRVIRILERRNATLTGTLKRSRTSHYIIPSDPRIIQDILVPDPRDSALRPKPKVDDKVIVRLHPWEQRHLNPEGDIIQVLGKSHTPMAEYEALLHQYNLKPDFPDAVLKEVSAFADHVTSADIDDREDFRGVYTMTIDPQDAKDFDDALSIEAAGDDLWTISIHIADVGHYVRPSSALDREARKRGNSTYLVGTVIPMLPHALSNGLCSLVENEDRLTKSVILSVTTDGTIQSARFANSVIRSNKRLTYEQAYAFMMDDPVEQIVARPDPPAHQTGSTGRSLKDVDAAELQRIRKDLRQLWSIASKLRKRRVRNGSLELNVAESKIYVDEQGYADKIVKIEQDESHQLVEEFMLAANESVARALNERNLAAIHRVHDGPDPEKLDEFSDYIESFGISAGDLSHRRQLNAVLGKIAAHPQAHILRIAFLRSLKQAGYRATPDGHFGLAKKHYAHFTSPIRRYADLVVHRIFARFLVPKGTRSTRKLYKPAELAEIAQQLSLTEQNSTEAERESVKIKLMEFFERELDKSPKTAFPAVIMDVRNHGMFVELTDSMAYGLVHISTLRDDLYKLHPSQTALVGRKQRTRYNVGDTIMVEVARVDRFKRQIDFAVAAEPVNGKKKVQRKKSAADKKPPHSKRPAHKEKPAVDKPPLADTQTTEGKKPSKRNRPRKRGARRS
jgi:ribonuclease R